MQYSVFGKQKSLIHRRPAKHRIKTIQGKAAFTARNKTCWRGSWQMTRKSSSTKRTAWIAPGFSKILLGLAAGWSLFPHPAWPASCCGGGSSASLIMPKASQGMVDIAIDMEKYNGFWNAYGGYRPDPKDSDLNQYRATIGHARRLGSRWQIGLVIPYVWNNNEYTGLVSHTQGPGDTTLMLWYEAFDKATCVWKVRSWSDLKPAIYLGPSLVVPTGISRFDKVSNSFDITGRGFYRADANLVLDKTIYPWNATLSFTYGKHIPRSVNRDYGRYVKPTQRTLGDRKQARIALGYTHFTESLNSLVLTLAIFYLQEDSGSINNKEDPSTRMKKTSITGGVTWSNMKRDWTVGINASHAPRKDGWGRNFPVTTTVSFKLSHVFG